MLRACVLSLALGLAAVAAQKKAPPAETMAGCVDQQEGRYILTGGHTLRKIAELEAAGFQQDGFAKFVGNRVTVTGEKKISGDTVVMRVRSIKQIAEGCAPDEQAVK